MTLHIIGNGFDLFHGMNTLYSDFCDFAWKNAKERGYFLGMLETVYPNTNINTGRLELWSADSTSKCKFTTFFCKSTH